MASKEVNVFEIWFEYGPDAVVLRKASKIVIHTQQLSFLLSIISNKDSFEGKLCLKVKFFKN